VYYNLAVLSPGGGRVSQASKADSRGEDK
jgi:hypothetical protein